MHRNLLRRVRIRDTYWNMANGRGTNVRVFGTFLIFCLLLIIENILPATDGFLMVSQRWARGTTKFDHNKITRDIFLNSNTGLHSSVNEDEDTETTLLPLLKLASAHCASQALYTAVQLQLPDILDGKQHSCSIDEICDAIPSMQSGGKNIPCNRDALLRTMRLLTTIDIVKEEELPLSSPLGTDYDDASLACYGFTLTKLGQSFVRKNNPTSMAPCILHWMEAPLWNAWLGLPDYIVEGPSSSLPFDRANGGISSDEWYNPTDHPESLQHANNFVRLIYDEELEAVASGFDWSTCHGHRLVDVGGHNGRLAQAIRQREPTLDCYCLDLPEVISSVAHSPEGVTLVAGNVLDPKSIPDCEVIVMKHFLDRSLFHDAETVRVLGSCKTALLRDTTHATKGKVVIADAVLPDCGSVDEKNELGLYLDALYMLVGRERQRTRREWRDIADAAGFDLVGVESTNLPSCSLIILETK